MQAWRLLACASVMVFAISALGQLTVDATGPVRQRNREATQGRGGGVGRRLPLMITLQTTGSAPDETGKTMLEFILTNTRKTDLTLPISPNPADSEPSDPKILYTVMKLGLRISLSNKPGVMFAGGAELYGSAEFPETVANLAPGDSIRVLARVALPEVGEVSLKCCRLRRQRVTRQ